MISPLYLIVLGLFILAVDTYLWSGIKALVPPGRLRLRKLLGWLFWGFTATSLALLFVLWYFSGGLISSGIRSLFFGFIALPLVSKLVTALFLVGDDIRRMFTFTTRKVKAAASGTPAPENAQRIPRSEFLTKTALIAGGGLAGTFIYGIVSGAHDYRIRRIRIPLKNLPSSFDGIKIAQLSDIHSGSFFNKTAVKGGVDMLLAEKPDLVLFTGDLVNDRTREVRDYIDIFDKVKAPLGVFSVLGNHDYGDYYVWPSAEAKTRNLQDMKKAHQVLGWDLLMDEHRKISVDGEHIGLIGIQNWGGGRFPKYGDLRKALLHTEELPVKLLLSHDPSHWDLQVRPEFPEIDAMFAGHTHGMQFGVEIPGFRWSPAQYNYKRWAGLYKEDNQFLYVNRGYGYLGYPGRVGILPEITIIELARV